MSNGQRRRTSWLVFAAVSVAALLMPAAPGRAEMIDGQGLRSTQAVGEVASTADAEVCGGRRASALPTTAEGLLGAMSLAEPQEDYVLLVDVSGSIQTEQWQRVVQALHTFLSTVKAQDGVALVAFGERADSLSATDARAATDALARIPRPSGQRTDIGLGIAQGLRFLERQGAAPTAAVLLFTDGVIDAPGSEYETPRSRGWEDLRTRIGRLPATTKMGIVFPFTGEPATGDWLQPLQVDTQPLVNGVDSLGQTVRAWKAQARATQARELLANDLSATVKTTWPSDINELRTPGGTVELQVTLRSSSANLPLCVGSLELRVEGAGSAAYAQLPARARPSALLDLRPRATADPDGDSLGPRARQNERKRSYRYRCSFGVQRMGRQPLASGNDGFGWSAILAAPFRIRHYLSRQCTCCVEFSRFHGGMVCRGRCSRRLLDAHRGSGESGPEKLPDDRGHRMGDGRRFREAADR